MRYLHFPEVGEHWFEIPINPEPWAVGDISIGRKNGKYFGRMSPNSNLAQYQNAVREELELIPAGHEPFPTVNIGLKFYFWRQRSKYIDAGDHVRTRNQADATNMQKGLEDALQGYLFDNDRNVRQITSLIVDQSTDIEGRSLICMTVAERLYEVYNEIPDELLTQPVKKPVQNRNQWPPPKGF